jgi:hypothetical protein
VRLVRYDYNLGFGSSSKRFDACTYDNPIDVVQRARKVREELLRAKPIGWFSNPNIEL